MAQLNKTNYTELTSVDGTNDFIPIGDASDSNTIKWVKPDNLPAAVAGAGSDTTAIHDNESSEISVIAEKTSPVSSDLLLIEDSAASNAKKRVQIGNLPSSGGETNTSSNVGTGGVGVFKQKTGVDFEFKKINAGSSKITITDDTGNDEVDIDIGTYNLSDLTDSTITSIASGEILKWDGAAWINNTLSEAGIAATSHTHAAADITSGTLTDARVAASNVTQHQAALSITESQISDLGTTAAMVADNLSVFAATTSAQLAGVISDETGSGALVFGTSPTIATPSLTLKQSAAPTPTAEGDIQWDTDDNTIKIGDGAATKTFSSDADVNIATSQVTSGTFADARIAASNVTQHQAALSITESQISDLQSYLLNVVEDTTPQLGGQLDVNGNAIGDGTLELLKFEETVSAVNEFTVKNNSTGNNPQLKATGDDTNIGVDLVPKGTGNVKLGNYTFDGDQTVGAGQDNYVLTYDNGSGLIGLEAAAGGGGSSELRHNYHIIAGHNPDDSSTPDHGLVRMATLGTGSGAAYGAHGLQMDCGTTTTGYGQYYLRSQGTTGFWLADTFFDNNPLIAFMFGFNSIATSAHDMILGCGGQVSTRGFNTASDEGFGFKITSNGSTITYHAISGSGTAETSTDVTSTVTAITGWGATTLADIHSFIAKMTSGTDIKFYVDGTLVATHTTNLPSGAIGSNGYRDNGAYVLSTGGTSNSQLAVHNHYVSFKIA